MEVKLSKTKKKSRRSNEGGLSSQAIVSTHGTLTKAKGKGKAKMTTLFCPSMRPW